MDLIADLGAQQSQATQETTCGRVWEVSQQIDDFSPPVDDLSQPIDDLHVATYGAGLYVIAEDDGSILTSPDGLTWTRHDLPINASSRINAVVWSGSQFIAVGDGHMVFASQDGLNWTSYALDKDYSLNAVTWGNGQFVAVGIEGNILTSPDGTLWTSHALDNNYTFKAVIWGNHQFVAVGAQFVFNCDEYADCVGYPGVILTSPDGITWTTRRTLDGESSSLNVVTWGNGQFVAMGETWQQSYDGSSYFHSGAILLTSLDGIMWTSHTLDDNYSVEAATWGNGQFVAVGVEQSVSGGEVSMILTSPDGITWTPHTLGTDYTLRAVTWGNGQFMAVGGQSVNGDQVGMILLSPDAVTWTPDLTGVRFSDVAWGNDQFVAVGRGGAVFTSPDGMTWTSHALNDNYSMMAVTWGNGQFVAVGSGGVVLTSPDGMTWTPHTLDYDYSLNAVTWGNGQFVALGGYESRIGSASTVWIGVILTSPDGITWTGSSYGDYQFGWGLYFHGVAWGNNQFVVVGGRSGSVGSSVLTSPDGITWTPQAEGNDYSLNAVTWGNGQFVAIESGSDTLTSSDGITWTSHALDDDYSVNAVTWGNDQFVAVGHQSILTSPDGIAWVPHPVDTAEYLEGIAWSGNQFVTTGGDIILRSDCSSPSDPATTLITHYYVSILRRDPEPDGLTFWQQLIAEKQAQGLDVKPVFRDIANFFFNSPEYLRRNTSDLEFTTNLYLTFFQREPDEGGLAFWLSQLATGMSRNEAMAGFLYSPEFTDFMERLGFGGA